MTPFQRHLFPAAACAALAAAAPAQSVDLRITGAVSNLAQVPPAGPFAGIQPGDPVTLALTANYPGQITTAPSRGSYSGVPGTSSLTIGGAHDDLLGFDLQTWNGAPDYIAVDPGTLAQGGFVRVRCVGASAALFPSPDLADMRGTFVPADFASVTFTVQAGGGLVEVALAEFTIGDTGLGAVYCAPAVPNSTGYAALLRVTGSDVLADDMLTLEALRLPQSTFGFFLTSSAQAQVPNPGGSQGVLCLGGSIGRYQAQVQSSGAAGAISLAVSPLALPQPTGAVAAQVGETWSFQAWYRDANPGPTSNFTDAVAVTLR